MTKDISRRLLEAHYMLPEDKCNKYLMYDRVTKFLSRGDPALQLRLLTYCTDGWLGLSSPILSNSNNKNKGHMISCFVNHVADTVQSMVEGNAEISYLSVAGGGVGQDLSSVRGCDGDKGIGVIPICQTLDATIGQFKQGKTRRGSVAAYLDIHHPDILEFIDVRLPTGGDKTRKALGIFNAVKITDEFMEDLEAGRDTDIICPKRGKIGTHSALDLWKRVHKARELSGTPYIYYTGNVDRGRSKLMKEGDHKVNSSNLCCVSGDTLVQVRIEGKEMHVPISTLAPYWEEDHQLTYNTLEVYDGTRYVESRVYLASHKDKLTSYRFKVTNRDGRTLVTFLDCTDNHKFYLEDGSMKYAKDLKAGDLLLEHVDTLDVVDGLVEFVGTYGDSYEGRTYCVDVPTTHRWVANQWVYTGNSEIFLRNDEKYTAVCCLSSVNLEYYDDWKDHPTFIQDCVKMHNNVLDITYADMSEQPERYGKVLNSIDKFRDIGLGVMGFHGMLMKKGIPFESGLALSYSKSIMKHIKEKAEEARQGNYNMIAIAPTANNALITGCTPSIEPITSNTCKVKTRVGVHEVVNPYLVKFFRDAGCDDEEVLMLVDLVRNNNGSVYGLDALDYIMSDEDKEVFKTAWEIDQEWVIKHAVFRQEFIDQGQSINLFFSKGTDRAKVSKCSYEAYKGGLKSLYYQRTATDQVSTVKKDDNGCLGCEG